MRHRTCIVAVVCLASALAGPCRASDDVSFNRDIRPILSRNCFLCHGPDRSSRKAALRLDLREEALEVIEPGDAQASVLMERIAAADPEERMPPPETHKTLTAREIELVRLWIDAGAEWERHWSFEPLARPRVPEVADAAWPRDPLDHFVLTRLERAGVAPSGEADRATWLRRVTLDLTGLPPTVEAIDAFLADDAPGAHERVVDRLLADPAFGERMATPWLDAARYADSYGYQSDQLSPTWPYRDWIVDALNRNLPYDAFVTWQLAGDLLPGATREQRLATAFNRLHRMTNEGGSIAAEFRNEYVSDRVHTFGTAFLGLTLECARCHDHKFDPITQRDYYAFSAFFNNIDEFGLYERTDIVPTPSLLLPTPEQEARLAELAAAVREAEAAWTAAREDILAATTDDRPGRFEAWKRELDAAAAVVELPCPDVVGRFPLDAIEPEQRLANLARPTPASAKADAPDAETSETPAPAGSVGAGVSLTDGARGAALAFDGDSYAQLPGVEDLDRWTPFTIAFWMRDDEPVADRRVVMHRSSGTDVGHFGIDLLLRDGHLRTRAVRHWPGNAIAAETVDAVVAPGAWTHVVWRYDGSSRADGFALFVNGRRAATTRLRDRVWKTVGRGHNYGPGGHGLVLGQRFRDRGFSGGSIDDLTIVRRAVSDLEARSLAAGPPERGSLAVALDGATDAELLDYYASAIDEPARTAATALAAARQAYAEHEAGIAEIAVMEELAEMRPAHVLDRGRYDAPRTEDTRVERGVPAVLPAWPVEAPRDRLGLARWLTQPDHPLTARVAANRAWQLLFGRGLVATSEDFGAQGMQPTHPKLLDWLAAELVASGWDTKALFRSIVLSATYRQASALDRPELRADPDNALLARGPSSRLSAEVMRDLALAASGLLEATRGGPPVSPYQPVGLWRESNSMSPGYRQSTGTALHRRSLYSVRKRTAPLPNMIAFDASTREVCTVRRAQTATPLQSLVLLNDPQFVEAARALGARMLAHAESDSERIAFGFRSLTGRAPLPVESALLLELLAEQREVFARDPEGAAALLATGEWPQPPGDPIDQAAATVVAQAMLNLDATGWKR